MTLAITVEAGLTILAFIAGLAAAIKAIEYLWRKAREFGAVSVLWWEERKRVRQVMAELTDPDSWPNGAKSLSASHRDLYATVAGVDRKLDELARAVETVITRGS